MVEQLFTTRREKGGGDGKEGTIVHREEEEKRKGEADREVVRPRQAASASYVLDIQGPYRTCTSPYGLGVAMRQVGDFSYLFLGVARKP